MKLYRSYLSLRFNWKAFGVPPVPVIGDEMENLVLANLVMESRLMGPERFHCEWRKMVEKIGT